MLDLPFDAFATVLIFLISVPAVIVQTMPPEVRRIVLKRRARLLLRTGLPVVIAFVAFLAGVWFQISPLSTYLPGLQPPDPLPSLDGLLWVILFVGLFVIATYTAISIPNRYGRREAIVERLEREARRRLKREGRLVESALDDLLELGRQSGAGQHKGLVLDALARLAADICESEPYRGDALESLVLGLVNIFEGGTNSGTVQNFGSAAEILKRVVHANAHHAERITSDADLLYAIRAMSSLGRAALSHRGDAIEIESLLSNYVEALSHTASRHPQVESEVSQALFELGVLAIRRQQMFIAVSVMDRLRRLVLRRDTPADGELAADVLGMVAHLWICGDAAREYAQRALTPIAPRLASPLPEALERARRHYLARTRFETADHVATVAAATAASAPT